MDPSSRSVRHILSLSGGKDSAALAVYLSDRIPDIEYVFADTGEELPETYEYLEHIEAYLGRRIVRLRNNHHRFADLLEARRGFLPSPQVRWCTEYLKIRPFEQYVGNDLVVNYIAIRADEEYRKGYISTKPNITPSYPFVEDGITKKEVMRILDGVGLGLPRYYAWRSRSGCYFCFFQQKIEWVGLLENHPDLFWKAASYEKTNPTTGERYTWSERESLSELARPERVREIKLGSAQRRGTTVECHKHALLLDVFGQEQGEWDGEQACLICSL